MQTTQVFRRRIVTIIALISLLWGAACQAQPAANMVDIALYSSSTKEDWINSVTETFNAAQIKTESGKLIRVRVTHVNSGDSKDDILEGKIRPTLWSPGDKSWVASANQGWQQFFAKLEQVLERAD